MGQPLEPAPHRFRIARLAPAQQTREAQADAPGQLADFADMAAALRELRHHMLVAQPTYVYSTPRTFGGASTFQGGAYAIANEFGSPAQYRVLQIAFQGAGVALIGGLSQSLAPAATTSLASPVEGQVYAAPGALTVANAGDGWVDIPGNGNVYLAVTAAGGNAVYATVQFRRRESPAGMFAEGHS